LPYDRPIRTPLQYLTSQYKCNYKRRSLSFKGKTNLSFDALKFSSATKENARRNDDFEEQVQ
jgi:hypothetical protein